MGYYHVKSDRIISELEKYNTARRTQKKAFNKVLDHYGEDGGLLTDAGILAIKYGSHVLRPKKTAKNKEHRIEKTLKSAL